MQSLQDTLSNRLTLNEILTRLEGAKAVDGLARFGSSLTHHANPVSDFDLLILVADPPVRIFQMFTHIDGCMADIVFVETETADAILERAQPVAATSFEGLFHRNAVCPHHL
jgi:predicted nucleotidyltransferase